MSGHAATARVTPRTAPEKLLRAPEVGAIIGASKLRVYELARSGHLPCVRFGRQVRFSPSKLAEWIERGGQSLPGGWRNEPPAGTTAKAQ